MVCRSTPGNSAVTTIARVSSGLHDVQVLSLFHELRSEAPRSTTPPNPNEQLDFLVDARNRTHRLGINDRGRRSLLGRLDAAEGTHVDGRTYYAWRRIEQEAILAREAMNAHFRDIATQFNSTPEEVEDAFNTLMSRDHRVNDEVPQAPEHVNFSTDNLPRDRGTRYALAMLHSSGPRVVASQPYLRLGYARIRRNSQRIAEEAQRDPANQCPECGQFAGPDHTCPPTTQQVQESARIDHANSVAFSVTAANVQSEDLFEEDDYDAVNAASCDRCGRGLTFAQAADGHCPSCDNTPPAAPQVPVMPDEDDISAEASQRLNLVPNDNGDPVWFTSNGQRFTSRGNAHSAEENNLRRDYLHNILSNDPTNPETSVEFIERVTFHEVDMVDPLDGAQGWVASDGSRYDRYEDALVHTYNLERAQAAARAALHCPTCGQFMGQGHVCDPADQPLAPWEAELLNGSLDDSTPHTEAPESTASQEDPLSEWERELLQQNADEAASEADRRAAARARRTPMRTYQITDGTSVQMMNLSTVRAIPNQSGQTVSDVQVQFPAQTLPSGLPMSPTVTGSVLVSNTGQRRTSWRDRFEVSVQPDGNHQSLRCTCPEYQRNYDCAHVRQARENIQALINQRDPRPVPVRVAAAPEAPAPTPAPTPASAPEPDPAPVRQRTAMRNYRGEDGINVRMLNISSARDTAPLQARNLDDVRVNFPVELDSNGHLTTATVTGSVEVFNTGRRRSRNHDRYTVTARERSLRCTCPDYQRNYDCIHVRQSAEHIQALLNQRDAVAVAPAAAMESVAHDLREDFDASLAASQAAREGFDATSDVSYSDDMTAFQAAWDEAKANLENDHRLPYMYENATNGLGARDGGRSIGIEIEVDFPDDMDYTAKQRVARDIYAAGLSDSPDVRPWHWRARQVDTRGRRMGGGYTDDPNMWSVEFDRSVDDVGGNRGCEIVSPILYDTPETWRNLKTICDIVERHGGRVTPRTGLHINVGAADFNHTVGNHNRLIGLANAYEDVIVRASHNPQAGPNHRGRDYCRPMEMPAEGFTSIRQAQRSIDPQNYEGSSHRAMINLDHVPSEGMPVQNSTRVEVRIFDGTIDPGRIQANVKLSLGMVDAAVRGVDVPRDQERAGTHRQRNVGANGRMRRLRGEDWERDTASFRRFVDTIFSRAEDKKQLTYAFAASRWQRR